MLVLGQETEVLSMNQAVSVIFETEIESSSSSKLVVRVVSLELSSGTFKLKLSIGLWFVKKFDN